MSCFLNKNKNTNFVSFCLKQAKISANVVRKIILIQKLNKIIFLAPLADIFACFKQKLTNLYNFFIIKFSHFTCQVNASWFKSF